MTINLKPWTNPTTGEVRIYINTRFERDASRKLDGLWLVKGANGKATICDRSGSLASNGFCYLVFFINGHQKAVFDIDPSFDELLERIANCQTPKGNLSVDKYQKRYWPQAA